MFSKLSYINTSSFLKESGTFAEQMSETERGTSSGSGASVVHHHHSHYGPAWGYYPYPQTVFVPSPGGSYVRPSNRSDKDEKDNTLIAILAGAAALVMLYPTAQNWAQWSQAAKGMDKVRAKISSVETEIANSHPALKNTVRTVYQKEMALLNHLRTDARNGFCWKALLGASLGTISYAAWFAAPIPPLAIAGGLLATGAMIWRSGIRSINNEVKTEARELQIAVQQADEVLNMVRG